MLPSCKQIAEQASENIDQPLSGMRWFKAKLHLIMCGYCRRYTKQMELSSQVVNQLSENGDVDQAMQQQVEQCFHQLHGKDKKQ
ncbi:MAG: hypothetical protein Q9M92_04845 [Enterobacterales bacterium]|nr:hypothetical protein [Enterobacterales bacterium]